MRGLKRQQRRAVIAAIVAGLTGMSVVAPTLAAQADGQSVSVVMTTADGADKLTAVSGTSFATASGSDPSRTIYVDDQRRYQTMVGWGATFTDSAAHVVQTAFSASQRSDMMAKLFNPSTGIGLSFLRQPAGATDYTVPGSPTATSGYYTYDDASSPDPTLSGFNAGHDASELVPSISAALAQNPALLVQLTSWTAPAWMKTTNSLYGGTSDANGNPTATYELNPTYYSTYAQYIVKAIQYYQAQGIPIWSTSAQNEPSVAQPYPGMYWDPTELSTFTNQYLAPALAQAGLQPQVLAADDVCFNSPVVSGELSNETTDENTSAVSLHGYCGSYTDLGSAHYFDPSKPLYQTELATDCPTRGTNTTGANSNPSGHPNLATTNIDTFPDFLVNVPRNWASVVTTWNVALQAQAHDALEPNWSKFGPYIYGNGYCTPLVAAPVGGGAPQYQLNYYWMGQFSKYVKRGAVRIGSNSWGLQDVEDVAFLNPDGSRVVVAYNAGAAAQTIGVRSGTQRFTYSLPSKGMATFTWSGTTSGGFNDWGPSAIGSDTGTQYAGGQTVGTWATPSTTSASNSSLDLNAWDSIYTGGDVALADFSASVSATRTQAGTEAHPKYGVYACYATDQNYIQYWIDPTNGQAAVHSVVNGADQGWTTTSLPGGFSPTSAHTLGWRRSGSTMTFQLDGAAEPALSTAVNTALPYCQLGLVTEDSAVSYQSFSVTDNDAWGNSVHGTDGSNPYGGGLEAGTWRVNDHRSADSMSTGSGWNSIYTDPTLTSTTYSYSAQARRVATGGTPGVAPKYGIDACYIDGSNYVQGWIDPTNDAFVTHGEDHGTEIPWTSVPLPTGFDPTIPHTIGVTRTGAGYAFTLDGAAMRTVTTSTSFAGCQVGLVTQDTKVDFRLISTP